MIAVTNASVFPSDRAGQVGIRAARNPTGSTDVSQAEVSTFEVTVLMKQQSFTDQQAAQEFLGKVLKSGKPASAFIDHRKPISPQDEAQRLAYQATNSNGRKRYKLAQRALSLWPNCGDAYLVLSEDEEGEAQEEVLENGSDAAMRAIAEEFGEELAAATLDPAMENPDPLPPSPVKRHEWQEGEIPFWTERTTRPFLRLQTALAKAYFLTEEPSSVVLRPLRASLRLCPHDEPGNRYLMAAYLMHMASDDPNCLVELGALLKRYSMDKSAWWLCTQAWWLFKTGDRLAADDALDDSVMLNKSMVPVIVGLIKPRVEVSFVLPGDESEAFDYRDMCGYAWITDDDVFKWLIDHIRRSVGGGLNDSFLPGENLHGLLRRSS